MGFPLGLPLSVSRGSVSGSGRNIPIDGETRRNLVQTDAAVNPGNSGGPLFSSTGEVVGLVDLGTSQAQGLAFAVSSRVAAPLLDAWRSSPQPVRGDTLRRAPVPTADSAPAEPPSSESGVSTFNGNRPICRTLDVSASAYYQRKTGRRSARAVEDERLLARIREVHEQNYFAYGYRRMWIALRRAGEQAGRCRVQRLMKTNGIQGAKRRGKPWRTTKPDPKASRRPDLVERNFKAAGPDRLWVADLTYLRCWEAWWSSRSCWTPGAGR